MNTKYPVALSAEQRQQLEKITSSGNVRARQMKRAQILLKSDRNVNWSYEQISEAFDVSAVTIAKIRKTFIEQGLEAVLQAKKADREYERILDGEGEAHSLPWPVVNHRLAEPIGVCVFCKIITRILGMWSTSPMKPSGES
jgi:acetolactate synthase regulatory subunit